MAKSQGLFFQLLELFDIREGSVTSGRMIDMIGHEIECHEKLSKAHHVADAVKFLRMSLALGAAVKLQRAIDNVVIGSHASRGCAVLRATLGDMEAMADVATSLMNSALWDEFDTEADRDARLVQSLGWFVISSGGRTWFPTLRSSRPDAPMLAGYDLVGRIRGMKSLKPYLASVIEDDDQPVEFGPRYRRTDVGKSGLPFHIVGSPASAQFVAAIPESAILDAGVVAAKIASRFPGLEQECTGLIDHPTSEIALRNLIDALEAQDVADAREEIEALTFVGAHLGDSVCLLRAASFAVRRGYHAADIKLAKYALGALSVASGVRRAEAAEDIHTVIEEAGLYMLQSIIDDQPPHARSETKATEEEKRDPSEYTDLFGDPGPDQNQLRLAEIARSVRKAPLGLPPEREFVRVLARRIDLSIAAQDIKSSLRNFDILSELLPLATMPDDLVSWRDGLLAEFPHAAAAIDAIYEDLIARQSSNRRSFGFRPTLFVGAPGCGKSRLARRLAETADLALKVFSCGGVADSHFAGVSRGWSTALPSVPLEFLRASRVPNPMLLLDEIEKSGTSRHNGNIIDVMLTMLDPETAGRWIDPLLQTPVDLSHINWIFTANSVDPLPSPFRDRVRVIQVPKPELSHLPQLASSVLRDLDGRSGWYQPLDQDELDAIAGSWGPSRSIRALRRLVEGVLKARELSAPRH